MRRRTSAGLGVVVVAVFGVAAFGASPALANDPPVCHDLGPYNVASGQPLPVQGNCDPDPDGPSALTYSVPQYPLHGSLSGNPSTGAATYQSYVGYEGPDSFTYRASDGDAFSDTKTATINVGPPDTSNQPPTCPLTNVFVEDGGFVNISGNCSDPDDGDSVTYGLNSFPTNGSLSIVNANTVTYTHTNLGTTSDSFEFTATDGHHTPLVVTVNISIGPSGAGTFETAPEATEDTPYVASVQTTQAGPVTINARGVTALPSDGYFLLNQEFNITAPAALSANDPLRLVFTIDGSQIPADPIVVFRNADPVGECTGAPGVAVPDPCVVEPPAEVGDDLEITVLTTQASRWNFGVAAAQEAYDFTGFFRPVDNRPTLNSAKGGSAIPVKFSLAGDQGLDVFAEGYPKSQNVSCDSIAGVEVDGIDESTATPGASTLSYDAGSDQYQYVWKTQKDWSGTCRQLVVKFNDPASSAHRANFKFK